MRGESRRQAGGPLVRSVRLVQDKSPDETDQRAERRSLSPDETLKLAEIMAELAYLDHLEAMRESNVASLKRLKDACDALLDSGLSALSATLPTDPPKGKDEPAKQ